MPSETNAGRIPLEQATLRLHPHDDVVIAKRQLEVETRLLWGEAGGPELRVCQTVPAGHKLAVTEIGAGQPVRRYGQVIGFAKHPIRPGEHVHKHNLGMGKLARAYSFAEDVVPVDLVPAGSRRTFMGFTRPDGRAGTRNYVAVISTVTCSAHVTRAIARHFTPERLAAFPNVDGVIALTHPSGCSFVPGGPVYTLLQRTLAGMARHPNVAASLFVGLGCEVNQISELMANYGLDGRNAESLVIQQSGGSRKTMAAGIQVLERMLSLANGTARTPQLLSQLVLALQCGGSDGWSGVTANPLVGWVADAVVAQGGTAVLGETPEIYGAEHLLTRRAINAQVGQKLVDKVRWWEGYTREHGAKIDNNPTPGNIAGGLTTIYEKSLGAIAKGGRTPLNAVFDYAEPVTARGLTFMDTPGNDPIAVTGQMAGGCNLVLFTTGRGSVVGFKPAPSIKIASNSTLYQRLADDIDFNAGRLLEQEGVEQLGAELLDLVIDVASGRPSKSEAFDFGEEEFSPWLWGEVL
jgi:altronate hydrolase